jgi:tRNA (guanine26-N2/guanine27-N2)-dimethyltransferase
MTEGESPKTEDIADFTRITEGSAEILFPNSNEVFYSHVQQFNRDMSIGVIRTYAKSRGKAVRILEALGASGLRSIRYAKELGSQVVSEIVANDRDARAVVSMQRNIEHNGVEAIVKSNHGDAIDVLMQSRHTPFDVIDLDPYGSAAPFIDAGVQAIANGGLLCVTCTDMPVLAGPYPETCFYKYGGIPIRGEHCHEQALRLLLNALQSSASRYQRKITPLMSMSVDYYIRVFVRVDYSPSGVKGCMTRSAMMLNCAECKTYSFAPLGWTSQTEKYTKYHVGRAPQNVNECEICGCTAFHMGGPMYYGPIHDQDFMASLLEHLRQDETASLYGTHARMLGIATLMSEELPDTPLFHTIGVLCRLVHCSTPPLSQMNSAILNAGYRVSGSHCRPTSIKTDAPASVLWDIIRHWAIRSGANLSKYSETTPARRIMARAPKLTEVSFELHPDADPPSRKFKLTRFEEHQGKDWGPRSRAKKRAIASEEDAGEPAEATR